MTRYASTAQAALIRRMVQSHVFTDAERAGIEARLSGGFVGLPGDCIDWLQSEIKLRKAAEKEAAEREQQGLNL